MTAHPHHWRAVYVKGAAAFNRRLVRVGSLCDTCDAFDPKMMGEQPAGMFSIAEVAAKTKQTELLVRQHISRGRLEASKVGNRSYVSDRQLMAYVEWLEGREQT